MRKKKGEGRENGPRMRLLAWRVPAGRPSHVLLPARRRRKGKKKGGKGGDFHNLPAGRHERLKLLILLPLSKEKKGGKKKRKR